MTHRVFRAQSLLGSLLVSLLVWNVVFSFRFASKQNGWIIGDWLVHYGGGFVRRGLSGELILTAASATGASVVGVFTVTLAVLYAAFFAAFFALTFGKRKPMWFLLTVFSPVTFLFVVSDASAVGRKEIVYLTLLALYVLLVSKGRPVASGVLVGVAAFLAAAATLMHELFFFYTPYFLAAAWVASGYRADRNMRLPVAVFAASGLATVAVVLFGREIDSPAVCSRLVNAGLSSSICDGLLAFPAKDLHDALRHTLQVASSGHYLSVYGASLLLGTVPLLILFIEERESNRDLLRAWSLIAAGAFAFSAPLFATALDWGRFLNTHFMSLAILSTLLLRSMDARPARSDGARSPGLGWDIRNLPVALALAILALVFIFAWGMPHCCGPQLNDGVVGKLNEVVKRLAR